MCINHYYEDTTPCKRLKAGWEVSGNDDQLTILNSSGQLRRSENEAKISLARPTPPKKVAEKCAFSKTLRMRCSIAQSTSHPSTLNIMKLDIGQNRSCDCHHATRDEPLWKFCRRASRDTVYQFGSSAYDWLTITQSLDKKVLLRIIDSLTHNIICMIYYNIWFGLVVKYMYNQTTGMFVFCTTTKTDFSIMSTLCEWYCCWVHCITKQCISGIAIIICNLPSSCCTFSGFYNPDAKLERSDKKEDSTTELQKRDEEKACTWPQGLIADELTGLAELGLGKAIDVTQKCPWSHKKPYQARKVEQENLIVTNEGNRYDSFMA